MFVYVPIYVDYTSVIIFFKIDRPACCEIRRVIRVLNARNLRPYEIHRKICEVYGQNAISEGMVRKWGRLFDDGRENVHDEERTTYQTCNDGAC